MVKRAALARALALDPKLLFLDEPTSGLDPVSAAAFDDLVLYLQQHLKLTIVMITHDLDSIFRTCNRVGVIVDRRMESDTLERIVDHPNPWIQAYFHGERARGRARERRVERDANYAAVGAFVLLVALLGALFVYWYSDTREHRDYNRYEIYFDGSVSGLDKGAAVRYLGVGVGRVYDMRIDPRDSSRVEVSSISTRARRSRPARWRSCSCRG